MAEQIEQALNYSEQAKLLAERRKKIDTEASTSKYIQLRPPTVTSIDGNEVVTYEAHPKIKESDTQDASLMINRISTSVSSSIYTFSRDEENYPSFETTNEGVVVQEPELTSTLGQYGKVHVKEDRGGNVFLFDFTEGNKRIFLKHDSGTYWNIENNGGSTFKAVGPSMYIFTHDKSEIISHNEFKKVNTDRIIQVTGEVHQTYGPTFTNIQGNNMLVCDGAGLSFYKTQRNTFVGGTDYSRINGSKIYRVGGTFIIESKDSIILRSPNVSIETGSIVQKTSAPTSETANGEKKISSDVVTIVGSSLTSLNGSNISFSQSGLFRHVIGGISVPPNTTAARIEVKAGSYEIETVLGRIDIQSLAMGMKFATLLAGLEISETGEIELSNKMGGLNINTIGEVEFKGAVGNIKNSMSALSILHNVKINLGDEAAKEPLVLGLKLMKWLNNHTHGTGTGPSTTPIVPATPADFNSTKVFGS